LNPDQGRVVANPARGYDGDVERSTQGGHPRPWRARARQATIVGSGLVGLPLSGFRSLPDFVVIGGQRCGSTSLHAALERHPAILTARIKEAHYFDHHHVWGERWYRGHFPLGLSGTLRQRRYGSRPLVGESTPYYLMHPLVPARLHSLIPNAKLICVLRDPVSRAYSHYQHEVARGHETLSFEDALAAEPERIAGERERLEIDPAYRSHAYFHHSYVTRGRYAEQLERWLALFPRTQILIVQSERLWREPGSVMAEVEHFLGIPESEGAVAFEHHQGRRYPAMAGETRRRLTCEFEQSNEELYRLLGERYDWASPARPERLVSSR